MSLILERT
jgi:26S proteasome regulatory subunit T6